MKKRFLTPFLRCAVCAAALLLTGCAGDLLKLEEGRPSDISVDALLSRMDHATDPHGYYAKVKSYRMKQRVVSLDDEKKDEYISDIVWCAPDNMRQISFRNGEPFMIMIYKGGKAWTVDPKTNKSTEITGLSLTLFHAFTEMARPGCNYRDIFKDLSVDIVKDKRTGRDMYRLICRLEDETIAPYVLYIDPKTWLTDRCETIIVGITGFQQLYVAESEDYIWQNEIRMSKRQLITVGDKSDVSTMLEYTMNPTIPAGTFDITRPWNHEVQSK